MTRSRRAYGHDVEAKLAQYDDGMSDDVENEQPCTVHQGLKQNCTRGIIGCITVHPEMCWRPKPGWWCSRGPNHDGPCAARPARRTRPRT